MCLSLPDVYDRTSCAFSALVVSKAPRTAEIKYLFGVTYLSGTLSQWPGDVVCVVYTGDMLNTLYLASVASTFLVSAFSVQLLTGHSMG